MEKSIFISAGKERTLDVAQAIFAAFGFEPVTRGELLLELQPIASRKRGPLKGISRITFQVTPNRLMARAELEGLEKVRNSMLWMLGLSETVSIIIFFFVLEKEHFLLASLISLLALGPWIFILPWLLRQQRRWIAAAMDLALIEVARVANEESDQTD